MWDSGTSHYRATDGRHNLDGIGCVYLLMGARVAVGVWQRALRCPEPVQGAVADAVVVPMVLPCTLRLACSWRSYSFSGECLGLETGVKLAIGAAFQAISCSSFCLLSFRQIPDAAISYLPKCRKPRVSGAILLVLLCIFVVVGAHNIQCRTFVLLARGKSKKTRNRYDF